MRLDASYSWRDRVGLTLGLFDTFGPANGVFYAANRTQRPDSAGYILQLDGTPYGTGTSPFGPRFNTRVGIQYFGYTEFNGAGRNYDGAGANAGDNNAVRVFLWAAY